MRRSTVIATCLVNSGFILTLETAEEEVRFRFEDEFPDESFDDWNRNLRDDATGESLVVAIGRAYTINARNFINELRKH